MRQALEQQQKVLYRLSPRARLDTCRQQVDELARRASHGLGHRLALRRSALSGLQARLVALSPLATLERGYAIVRQADGGAVVRSVAQVRAGDLLDIRVQDGEFGAVAGDRGYSKSKDGANE
jgi:exodeoxyribonuclease VII large subunit